MVRSKRSSHCSMWPATESSDRSSALPQSSSSVRRPIAAIAAVNETCSSRSRIRGGLISDGTSTAAGPSPPWSRNAAPRTRAISGLGGGRSRRGAHSYARNPARASDASCGSRSDTSRTNSRNSGNGRGARSCCSALSCGSKARSASGELFMAKTSGKVTIKKYANRRLYDTETSAYITLDKLAQMVREGREFEVVDAKSGEDITRQVLTQIIVDEEARGTTMLPINFLKQLIGLYGNSMQNFVPQYLEAAMDAFQRNQSAVKDAFGANVFADLAKRNMAMFEDASRAFSGKKTETKPSGSEVDELKAELAALKAKVDRL